MPRPAYPTGDDLAAFLKATGLPGLQDDATLALLDCAGYVAASVAEWERRTRWNPFLAATQTRLFDPQGANDGMGGRGYGGLGGLGGGSVGGSSVLMLDAGLLSASSVVIGLSDTNTVGETLTEKRDYWLQPTSAPHADMPYLFVKFRFPLVGEPQSVAIAGDWGRARTVPDDAWTALLQYAGALVLPQVMLLTSGGLDSWTEAGVSEKYGAQFGGVGALWNAGFERAVPRYKRVSL